MASKTLQTYSSDSASTQNSAPDSDPVSDDGTQETELTISQTDQDRLAAWIRKNYVLCKNQRQQKLVQWQTNLLMFFGYHWAERNGEKFPMGFRDGVYTPKVARNSRKIINRTRMAVRSEISRFISNEPTIIAIPASGEDEDTRSAFAAEQVWESMKTQGNLLAEWEKAIWWVCTTGNGFVKTWWDNGKSNADGSNGSVCYGRVSPFNLFVPDLREVNIEDQPYVIFAYIKPVEWCNYIFADDIKTPLTPSVASTNQVFDEGQLNLSAGQRIPDSCIVYETWIKPGATKMLPQGGTVISVDDRIIRLYPEGMPYQHGQYPFSHFTHVPTETFYAESPLTDTNALQKEYNKLRSDISEAGNVDARPRMLATKGSIVPPKVTNKHGLIIEVKPGMPMPQPFAPTPMPEYYINQQETILQDWSDLTGMHDATQGEAPTGVTAGTAINYLQEIDNQFLTPEYNSVERGFEKIAKQTVQLFQQYADTKRSIAVVGAEASFDISLLSGHDIRNGTQVKVEAGSSVPVSQAAKQARAQDLFQIGLIDGPTALAMMDKGGPQKVIDIFNAAQIKAQRENIKMARLSPEDIEAFQIEYQTVNQEYMQAVQQYQLAQQIQAMEQEPISGMPGAANVEPLGRGFASTDATQPMPLEAAPPPQSPTMTLYGDPAAVITTGVMQAPGVPPRAPVVPVSKFDVHSQHILTHNQFRMTEKYDLLPPEVKQTIDDHVNVHMALQQQQALQQFLQSVPSDGTDPTAPDAPNAMSVPDAGIAGTVAGNGVVPQGPEPQGGPTGG